MTVEDGGGVKNRGSKDKSKEDQEGKGGGRGLSDGDPCLYVLSSVFNPVSNLVFV